MTNIHQVSIFVENKKGRIHKITRVLADNNIDIRALSIAETEDYGILRLIMKNPENAVEVLREKNISASLTPVIVVAVEDKPGGLVDTMGALEDAEITVEYMYAFLNATPKTAFIVLRVENREKAIEILDKAGVKLLSQKDLDEI